jgi:hypothetical protein
MNNRLEPSSVLMNLVLYYKPFVSLEPNSKSKEPYLFNKVPDYFQAQISNMLGILNRKPDRRV